MYVGDWYHYGDNFVTRALPKGKKFVILYGFLIENDGDEDNLELIVTKMIECEIQ
jgi:hypothetical protein